MNLIKGSKSVSEQENVAQVCPFLGIHYDPKKRAVEADKRHHCNAQKPSKSVEVSYQESYCLSQAFSQCPIFTQAHEIKSTPISKNRKKQDAEAVSGSSVAGLIAQDTIEETITPKSDTTQQEGIKVPSENADVRKRLHAEALNRLEETPRSGAGSAIWIVLLVIGSLVLLVGGYGVYTRYTTLVNQPNPGQSDQSGSALATAVSEMGLAANAWATAANSVDAGVEARATSEAAAAAALVVTGTAQTTQTVGSVADAPACRDNISTVYALEAGPTFQPNPGYEYVSGSPSIELQAAWVLNNTSNCTWESVALWSLEDGKIIQPILLQDGEPVSLANQEGKIRILPGERLEIVVKFGMEEGRNVQNEWVILVNEIALFSQSHLELDVRGWYVVVQPKITGTPTPTPGLLPTRPATAPPKPPADRPTSTPPSTRPSATPGSTTP